MELKYPEGKISWEPPMKPGFGPVQKLVCVQCVEGNWLSARE